MAKAKINNITLDYFGKNVHEVTKSFLNKKFFESTTVKSTLGYHAFIPLTDKNMYASV